MTVLSLLVGTMVVCTGCISTSSVHPQFASRTRGLTNLVVMPVQATAVEVQATGARLMPFPQQAAVCQQLGTLIAGQFQSRGFPVVQSKLTTNHRAMATNDVCQKREIWMQLQLVRARQTLARVGGYARGKIVRPEAPLLAGYEGADALIFVSACVVTESPAAGNERLVFNTVSVVVGLGASVLSGSTCTPVVQGSPEGCSLEVVLVEGRTGEILWRSWMNPDSLDASELNGAVPELFSAYPDRQKTDDRAY